MRKAILALAVLFFGVALSLAAQEQVFRTTGSIRSGVSASDAAGEPRNTYRVRVQDGSLLEVVAASSDVDTWLDVVLPDGTEFSNDDYDGLNAGFLRVMPAAGHLVLTVSSLYAHQEGSYELTVREMPRPRIIQVGDRVAARLDKGSADARRNASFYAVTGRAGDMIVIDLLSEDFDAFLEVVDSRGQIFFDDDGGRGFNSRLPYRFEESGTLIITATSALGQSVGEYELRVTELARTPVARYDGFLRAGGRRAYDGTLFEVYEYNGRMGQSVTILLESDDFDPVLFLSHADGRPLAMDDDSGGDGNSLLDVVLPSTETYRIFVTPFYESEGAYRLTVFE